MSPRLSPEAMATITRDYRPPKKEQPTVISQQLPKPEKRVQRLERVKPDFSGWETWEQGLPFKNGFFDVWIEVLNGRGQPTGKTEKIASFAVQTLADQCRERINSKNHNFQARVEADKRENQDDLADGLYDLEWPGAVEIQGSSWLVAMNALDGLGRNIGGGLFKFFKDQASAQACADIINRTNPAFQAVVERDELLAKHYGETDIN